MRTIKLEAYNKKWKKDFKKEIIKIKAFLSKELIGAYHIGSTAILGIKAKPTIDILLEVNSINNIDKYNDNFIKFAYTPKGENGIKERRFFQKGGKNRTHHIHVFQQGNPEIKRHILFTGFLNAHQENAIAYEKLKIELSTKYNNQPNKYSQGKSSFIQKIDDLARDWNKNVI